MEDGAGWGRGGGGGGEGRLRVEEEGGRRATVLVAAPCKDQDEATMTFGGQSMLSRLDHTRRGSIALAIKLTMGFGWFQQSFDAPAGVVDSNRPAQDK